MAEYFFLNNSSWSIFGSAWSEPSFRILRGNCAAETSAMEAKHILVVRELGPGNVMHTAQHTMSIFECSSFEAM